MKQRRRSGHLGIEIDFPIVVDSPRSQSQKDNNKRPQFRGNKTMYVIGNQLNTEITGDDTLNNLITNPDNLKTDVIDEMP